MIAGGHSYFGASYWGVSYWGADAVNPNAAVYGSPKFVRRVLDRSGRPAVAVARDTSERVGSVPATDMAERISVRPGRPSRRIGRTIQ